jgi:hypothetical protein
MRSPSKEFEELVLDYPANASQPWGEGFTLIDSDLDFINNLLLEEGAPMESDPLAVAVIRERLQGEAKRRARLSPDDVIYRPRNAYRIGQRLVFPTLGFIHGTVTAIRPGVNPETGPFDVIRIQSEGGERELASNLANHRLNTIPLELLLGASDRSPEQILADHGNTIRTALESKLSQAADIVKIGGRWFPRSLLIDISHGHLNLAEAVLDVAGGGPLPTSALLEHIDLPRNVDPRLASFSLEYALYQDERFEEVGPAGEMAWFLRRLEPPEVMFPPRRLAFDPAAIARPKISDSLLTLERELDDEWGSTDAAGGEIREVGMTLNFPHWRVGTLPLTARLAKIFPHAHQATRIRFEFVDQETGERFPGWVVAPFRYVFGLAEWYPKKGLLPGGMLKIRDGNIPGEIILEAATRKPAREWIRTASAAPNNRLTFSMQKQAVAVNYDELSVIAVDDPRSIDDLWLRLDEQKVALDHLVSDVFRELAKLNPQSTVHARTLYGAINVVRRTPPGPIFAELMARPYYSHMGDLYYRFDEVQWTENR